jgi:hypothetical protein
MSIIVATVIIPMRAARGKNGRRGLRKAIVWMVLFNLIYLFALLFIYGRLE